MNYPLPVFILPGKLRKLLSAPQGTLYISNSIIRGLMIDYAVGDIVSSTLEYRVNIVDFKTRREKQSKPPLHAPSIAVINPQGTMSINSRTMIKAVKYKTYIVYGEEDLLPLAISLEYDNVDIAYGQPGIGVVVLKSSRYRARRLLKAFKPALY